MARRNQAEIVLTARDRTKSAFRSVNKNLGRLASIGLAGAVAGVVLLTKASLQQIDALAKQSQLLGITTEKLAAFQLVAAKTGVEQKTLEKSLINVTRVVAEAAEGTGLATDTLKKLGLEAKALSLQSPDEQFIAIGDAMRGLNSQAEKVLASYELFGGRGAALLRTLEAGSEAFEEAEEKTKRFGTAISAVDAKGVEDANDAFTDLAESVKGVGFDLARRFAPGMEAASTSTANFVVSLRRDVIPAFALLLEQLDLVISNVRGLSDIELAVRIEVQLDKIEAAEEAIEKIKNAKGPLIKGFIDPEFLEAQRKLPIQERERAEARLAEVKDEQKRRAGIILDAEKKLQDMKAAQLEEARVTAEELEKAADRESFDARLEREEEKNSALISVALKRASELRKLAFRDARDNQRRIESESRLEERLSQNIIRLRQGTAATSVRIAQVLLSKSKTVSQALFLVEKGLAIARTVQNTAAASIKVFADLPYPAAVAASAQIQAFGAAQVGLIAATALTGVGSIGGGGPSIGIGGGAGGGTSDFSGGGFGTVAQFGGGGTPAFDQGVVQLIFPSVFGITPEVIDALADAFREASENRDIIIVSGQGRNAEILQGANG